MQIEVITDRNVEGTDQLIAQIERAVDDALARVSHRLTRVKVHLGDENAGKGGADDKRCIVEARPAGQSPVAVTNHGGSPEEACRGALQKLGRLLETRFARLDAHKGGATIRQGDKP